MFVPSSLDRQLSATWTAARGDARGGGGRRRHIARRRRLQRLVRGGR